MAVQKLENVQAKPSKPEPVKPKAPPKPVVQVVQVEKAPEPKLEKPAPDFYAALEAGDLTAGFVASHGTWQKWVSNIQTPDGRRGVHETKLVPCTCELCTDAIKKKGWTF